MMALARAQSADPCSATWAIFLQIGSFGKISSSSVDTWYSWIKKPNYDYLIIWEIDNWKRYWKKRMRRYEAGMFLDIFVKSSFFEWGIRFVLRGKLFRNYILSVIFVLFVEIIF